MPVWLWWFIPVFVVHVILAFIMSPPEVVANWFFAKFELHPQLSEEDSVVVTTEGNQVQAEEKRQFIDAFNKAIFIERYYQILPKYAGTPVIVKTRQRKAVVKLFVYAYDDHVDVFKQLKKKVIAYRLISYNLQSRSTMTQAAPEA